MILNNADNIMLGGSEVDRVYCGSVVVWQRGGNIPAEVLAYAQDIITHYNLSGEIGVDYSLLYCLSKHFKGEIYYKVCLFDTLTPNFQWQVSGSPASAGILRNNQTFNFYGRTEYFVGSPSYFTNSSETWLSPLNTGEYPINAEGTFDVSCISNYAQYVNTITYTKI